MNRRLTYILTLGLLLISGVAMGQRADDPENPVNNTTAGVKVGGNVFGGGNLANVKGNSTVLVNQSDAIVTGDVYGGGALAHVNVTEAVVSGETTYSYTSGKTTQVDVIKGKISGNIYGGGLGDASSPAKVYGPVTVNIGTGTVDPTTGAATDVVGTAVIRGSVFGCNNVSGTPLDDVTVNIFSTSRAEKQLVTYTESDAEYAIDSVFGGGNKASYVPAATGKKTTVNVYTCENTIQKVYGGGNAADVGVAEAEGVKSSTNINLYGGRFEWVFGGGNGSGIGNPGANIYNDVNINFHAGDIKYLFGGSNAKGTIGGEKNVEINNDITDCSIANHIMEFYGGNNKADIESGGVSLTMACPTNDPCKIDYVFGGSREADITGDVTLTINGGEYDYVFGGNNIDGEINGNVTLNLFGGTINEAAFGGNKGGGSITGNVTVNVEDAEGNCPLVVNHVFGAGDQAIYTAPTGTGAREFNPMVNINHIRTGQSITGNVYGGGNGDPDNEDQEPGMVTGKPKVTIGDLTEGHSNYRAAISGNVFGGGNAAKVVGTTTVLMQQANSTVNQNIFGGGNLANVSDSTTVNVNGGTVTQDVYGGGALANVGGSNVTLGGGTVRNIYGGGLGDADHEAQVGGDVLVTVNSGTVTNVFGCNNVNGAPTSTSSVQVDINGDVAGSVYGGGNQASGSVNPQVNILAGTVAVDVFGGGLGDADDDTKGVVTGNPSVTINGANAVVNGSVYGGGSLAPTIGDAVVTLTDGATVKVFGGGKAANVTGNPTVQIDGGTVSAGVYGGCDSKGVVTGNITVNVDGGTIGTSSSRAFVHGGGYGQETGTSGNVEVNVAQVGATSGATIYGDVYGGSALGNVNNTAVDNEHHTKVTVNNGTIVGCVYGGGLGSRETGNEVAAMVYSPVTVTVNGGSISTYTEGSNTIGGNVFGCNNENGAPQSTVQVDIRNNVGNNVFGGGNLAAYSGTPNVNIISGTVSGKVFGGGNEAGVGGGNVAMTGGTVVGGLYGGCNTSGTVGSTTNMAISGGIVQGSVYGGGFGSGTVVTGKATVHISGTSTEVQGDVFGGGEDGKVNGGTEVKILETE